MDRSEWRTIPQKYRRNTASRCCPGKGGAGQDSGRINYSAPRPKDSAPLAVDMPEQKTKKPLSEEEKQKADREIRDTWDGMKKALRGY
jgi:hypothetical protein